MTKYDKYATIWIIFCILTIGLISTGIIASAEESNELIEIEQFLKDDTTDQNERTEWYTCGHFVRDLSRNASKSNISIGAMILGNHPRFSGRQNHITNYAIINGRIAVIDVYSDYIYELNKGLWMDDQQFKYYRLYPDGTQVPSFWTHNLAYTGIIL